MHIIWIHRIAPGQGCVERYLRDIVPLLDAEGVRSTLLYDPGSPYDNGVRDAFAAAHPLHDLMTQVRELAPDVLFVHRPPTGLDPRGLPALGVPVLRFIHDDELSLRERDSDWQPPRRAALGTLPLKDLGPTALPPAAAVVAARYLAPHAVARGFDPAHVRCMPLYARPVDYVPVPSRRPHSILYAGGLTRDKGVDILLSALARLPGAHLEVIGDGPERSPLERQSHMLGVARRVDFLGAQPPGRVAELMASARVLVIPSRAPETFALAGPEAMASGTPIVATRVGGIGDWLTDGENGFSVPAERPAALAVAIARVLDNDALAARIGAVAFATHRQRFMPAHHVRPLLELLAELTR